MSGPRAAIHVNADTDLVGFEEVSFSVLGLVRLYLKLHALLYVVYVFTSLNN